MNLKNLALIALTSLMIMSCKSETKTASQEVIAEFSEIQTDNDEPNSPETGLSVCTEQVTSKYLNFINFCKSAEESGVYGNIVACYNQYKSIVLNNTDLECTTTLPKEILNDTEEMTYVIDNNLYLKSMMSIGLGQYFIEDTGGTAACGEFVNELAVNHYKKCSYYPEGINSERLNSCENSIKQILKLYPRINCEYTAKYVDGHVTFTMMEYSLKLDLKKIELIRLENNW